MTKGQWIEYTGSDEQIAEILNSETGVLCRYRNGTERLKSSMFIGEWNHKHLTHYLICNPHPLRDMIKQQADTGQEVWVKEFIVCDIPIIYSTTTPDWNLDAEYSFTPFEEK